MQKKNQLKHSLVKTTCAVFTTGVLFLLADAVIISGCAPSFDVRGESHSVSVSGEPVYLAAGAAVDVRNLVSVMLEEPTAEESIQYIVRNEDGTPSSNITIVNGTLSAKETGNGYLYAYVNGEVSTNAIPIHVMADEEAVAELEELKTVLKQQEPMETEPGITEVILEEPVSSVGYTVVLTHSEPTSSLKENFVQDYYSLGLQSTPKSHTEALIQNQFAERNAIHAFLDQDAPLLPRIWHISKEGDRTLVDPSEFEWKTSDDAVISVSSSVPEISGEGTAVITGTSSEGAIEITVTVSKAEEVDNFKTRSKEPYTLDFEEEGKFYRVTNTYYWPNTVPEEPSELVEVKNNRLYQIGSQYYYLEEEVKTSWDKISTDDLIQLSTGLVLMEGDSLSGIVKGVIFRHKDQFWVYAGSGEAVEPLKDDTDWIEITDLFGSYDPDYVPGADTGPESDAPSYPDSQYNPYPGGLNNCTWTVWYLANQALGVRLPNWGDAGNWYRRAGISGYATGSTPAVNSIIVYDHHVGFVTAVSEDGSSIYIKEGNFSGKYHEGWWPVASSRHGQQVYGYIYLNGAPTEHQLVVVESGFTGSEEAFLAAIADLGLEPGNRQEGFSDTVEKGDIISYTTGELPVGSVVDYVVSLGEEPVEEIELDPGLIGHSEEEFLAWLDKNGLLKGAREEIETEEAESGTLLSVSGTTFRKGDRVDYRVAKKIVREEPEESPVPEETPLPSEPPVPEESAEPVVEPTPEPEEFLEPVIEPTPEIEDIYVPEETPEPTPEVVEVPEEIEVPVIETAESYEE